MNDHLKEFLKLLNSHEVEYLLIGAHAFGFYGHERFTEDVDLWIGRTELNVGRLAEVLEEFGLPFPPGGYEAFLQPRRMVRLGTPPNRLDLMNFAADLSFEEVWPRRTLGNIEGVPVCIISREDFIQSKLKSGRPKDLRDLEEMGEL